MNLASDLVGVTSIASPDRLQLSRMGRALRETHHLQFAKVMGFAKGLNPFCALIH
jgi:hypothetical protein